MRNGVSTEPDALTGAYSLILKHIMNYESNLHTSSTLFHKKIVRHNKFHRFSRLIVATAA